MKTLQLGANTFITVIYVGPVGAGNAHALVMLQQRSALNPDNNCRDIHSPGARQRTPTPPWPSFMTSCASKHHVRWFHVAPNHRLALKHRLALSRRLALGHRLAPSHCLPSSISLEGIMCTIVFGPVAERVAG